MKWSRWLFIVGTLLLLPGAWAFVGGSLRSDEDAAVAHAAAVRLALDSLRTGAVVRLYYDVPQSAQWVRIRRARTMGDPGYIAMATERPNGKVIPFSPLGIEMSISGRRGPLALELTGQTPYGHSSDTDRDVGLRFRPEPGDELQIVIKATDPGRLPQGELVVKPFWNWSAKDYLVGGDIDADLRPIVIGATYAGMVLLIAGVAIRAVRRRRGV